MITVRNLTKRFGEFLAVDQVSFELDAGEVIGFLGPNGAGKTTTLRILTGYLPATSGTARIDGLDVLEDSLKVRQRLGYLPENVPLYSDMRVHEYLRYRGRLKGVPAKEIKIAVEGAMDRCGLSHMARRIIGQLSKGYRQRVGLADALVSRPKILILDEPTGGLDPAQRKEVLDLIKGLSQEHTVLLSSHILAEVEAISTRVMIIQRGRLLASGAPRELGQQLQEAPRISVEVRAAEGSGKDQALNSLATLGQGLEADTECKPIGDGWWRLRVPTRPGDDLRPPVGRALFEAGLDVRELRVEAYSLEELFLRITAEAASEAPL